MNGKKIAIIGGGHGTSIVLSGLSDSGYELSAILSMADNGGSTGRLRTQLGVSAVGDIRQCLVAAATKPREADLFAYRFDSGELSGHSVGNLILSAGELRTGSLEKSIEIAKEFLGASADIIPATEDKCDLVLSLGDKKVSGVYEIANIDFEGKKPGLSLQPPAKLSDSAARAIESADMLIIAPGNFYCSIMPALLVEGMAEAVNNSRGKVAFICNLVNRQGQTGGFTAVDYIKEADRLTGGMQIDTLIYNTAPIAPECLRAGEQPVNYEGGSPGGFEAVGREIADPEQAPATSGDKIADVRSLVRHDRAKLAKVIAELADSL